MALAWFSFPLPNHLGGLARLLGPKRCLDRADVARDARYLTDFYQEVGYPETTVDTLIAPARDGRVDVIFVIKEALPITLDSVTVTWETVPLGIDTAALRRRLYSVVGRPFNLLRTNTDGDTLEQALRNRGYPDVTALYTDTLLHAERRARVSFDIYPGRLVRLGEVNIQATAKNGAPHLAIRPEAVRPLLGLKTGDPYSESALLDAQRHLYELGTYVAVNPDIVRQPGDSAVIDATMHLQEGDMHQLSTEAGWATLDCGRASAHVTDRALFQTTQRLELNAQASKIEDGDVRWRPTSPEENLLSFQGNALANDSLGSSKLNYNLTTNAYSTRLVWRTRRPFAFGLQRGAVRLRGVPAGDQGRRGGDSHDCAAPGPHHDRVLQPRIRAHRCRAGGAVLCLSGVRRSHPSAGSRGELRHCWPC